MLMIRFVAPAGNHPEYGSRWRIFFRRSWTRGSSVFRDFGLLEPFAFLLIFFLDAVAIHMVAWANPLEVVPPSEKTWSKNDDDRDSVRGDDPVLRPVHASVIQYFEHAGS